MSITATNKSTSNYEPVPAGTYVARCYSMIHIGTNTENIMGTDKDINKVRIGFELPTETKVFKEGEEAKPYVISKEYTLSMHEKGNLRKMLEGWRGKGFTDQEAEAFDITVLLGKPCMLNIIHKTAKNGNTYAEISSVSNLIRGMECPPQVNKNQELSYENFDFDLFESLPDFLKDKIKSSKEYKKLMFPESTESIVADDELDPSEIPF